MCRKAATKPALYRQTPSFKQLRAHLCKATANTQLACTDMFTAILFFIPCVHPDANRAPLYIRTFTALTPLLQYSREVMLPNAASFDLCRREAICWHAACSDHLPCHHPLEASRVSSKYSTLAEGKGLLIPYGTPICRLQGVAFCRDSNDPSACICTAVRGLRQKACALWLCYLQPTRGSLTSASTQ